MFRRSYGIEYDPEHKDHFLSDVLFALKVSPYAMRKNKRPYDMFKAMRVETLHYIIWYDHSHYLYGQIEALREHLMKQWFFIQENPVSEKSFDEVDHFHAIRVLKYV